MSAREQGTVVRWNDDRGFGFVKPDRPGERDLFAHVTAFPQSVAPDLGARVEYDIAEDRGRQKAVNVQVLAAPAAKPPGAVRRFVAGSPAGGPLTFGGAFGEPFGQSGT